MKMCSLRLYAEFSVLVAGFWENRCLVQIVFEYETTVFGQKWLHIWNLEADTFLFALGTHVKNSLNAIQVKIEIN